MSSLLLSASTPSQPSLYNVQLGDNSNNNDNRPLCSVIPKHRYYEGIRTLERFIMPFIEQTLSLSLAELEKLSRSDKESTFLHNIARFSRDPKVIRDQIMAVLIAGRDTTAATLSWTVYELCHHPAAVRRLRADILSTVGPSRSPTYDDLKAMTYLTHTLNEALRLYPAVPYNLRAALVDTTLPGRPGQPDIAVLKDDVVIYSAMSMQRRPDLYPPASPGFAHPAVFSPDRWDVWAPRPWNYVPFNGGPRICVGQNFAMTEMGFTREWPRCLSLACLRGSSADKVCCCFPVVRLFQRFERLEYRGDWHAQFHKAEIVGAPGHGVPVAFYGAEMA